MKNNSVLVIGSIIVVIFTLLWAFQIVEEPIAALSSAVLTLVGYLLMLKQGNVKHKNEKPKEIQNSHKSSSSSRITQNHSGSGDNVAGDKVTYN